MSRFRQVLPVEGLAKIEIKLWRGDLTIRGASAGTVGVLESDGEMEVTTDGNLLHCKQIGGLATLLGEQQVRIAIDGNVLYEKQLRFSGSNVSVVLPASVRELRCRIGHGDIRLDDVDADVSLHIGMGNAFLSSGRGRLMVRAGASETIRVFGWQGPVEFSAGTGDMEAEVIDGDVKSTIGKGSIKIDGAARVEAKTGAGDLAVSRISGEAVLRTGKGHILGTSLNGVRLDTRTGKGEIALSGHLAGLKAVTGCGEIICRCDLAEGTYDLRSGSGHISFDLPDGIEVRIDASARHGRIESDLPLIKVGTTGPAGYFGKRLVGSIGSAEAKTKLFLRAEHGDIRIFRLRPEGEAGPIERQAGQEEDRERIILEAVSRSEISVDEAMMLLDKSTQVEA